MQSAAGSVHHSHGPGSTHAVAPNQVELTDTMVAREAFRVVVEVHIPHGLPASDCFQALTALFRSQDAGINACSWNHRVPSDIVVDLDTSLSRRAFLSKYDHVAVQIDDVQVELAPYKYDGPTQAEWSAAADTVCVRNLPLHWFGLSQSPERAEYFDATSPLRSIFGAFGTVKDMDVEAFHPPATDAERENGQFPLFPVIDVWVQFSDHAGFVGCMSALSNCTFLHKSGEAIPCMATFDTTSYFGSANVRKREAKRLVKKQQARLAQEAAEKRVKKAKARIARLNKSVLTKLQKLSDEFEIVLDSPLPTGADPRPRNEAMAQARTSIRKSLAAVRKLGITVPDDVVAVLDRPSSATSTTTPQAAGTEDSLDGGPGAAAATATGSDDVVQLEAYDVSPALKAINSSRWSVKRVEQTIDEAVSIAKQALPSVAQALEKLKADRFLEVRIQGVPAVPLTCARKILRNHYPPLDVRGKTIFVVCNAGLYEASIPTDPDDRFRPPPSPHKHPYHEASVMRLSTALAAKRAQSPGDSVAVDLVAAGLPEFPPAALLPTRREAADLASSRSIAEQVLPAAAAASAVDMLVHSTPRSARPVTSSKHGKGVTRAVVSLPALHASSSAASTLAEREAAKVSAQALMVAGAQAHPDSFTSHSRLVNRLNYIRATYMHYQQVFAEHNRLFQESLQHDQPFPTTMHSAEALLESIHGIPQYQPGLQLTSPDRAWPHVRPTDNNFGSSVLPDGTSTENPFRPPATDPFVEPDNPFRPPTPPGPSVKTIWEARCMGVHVLDGPYSIQDLSLLDNGRMPTLCSTHQLRTRVDKTGTYVVWAEPLYDLTGTSEHAHNDQFTGLMDRLARKRAARNNGTFKSVSRLRPQSPELYLRAKVLKANFWCADGTVVHLIDRVMFPDEFNEDTY